MTTTARLNLCFRRPPARTAGSRCRTTHRRSSSYPVYGMARGVSQHLSSAGRHGGRRVHCDVVLTRGVQPQGARKPLRKTTASSRSRSGPSTCAKPRLLRAWDRYITARMGNRGRHPMGRGGALDGRWLVFKVMRRGIECTRQTTALGGVDHARNGGHGCAGHLSPKRNEYVVVMAGFGDLAFTSLDDEDGRVSIRRRRQDHRQ